MVCSLVKKAVAGAALGVAALWVVSGTPAYNYVKTLAQCKVDRIKSNVPVDLQIAALKSQISEMESLMHGQIQSVAREEQEVKDLKSSLSRNRLSMVDAGKKIVALRETIPAVDVQLTSDAADRDQVLRDLKNRMGQFGVLERTVATQETTLANREQALTRAKDQLAGLKDKKQELISRLDLVATQFRANQAAQQGTQAGIDTSALTQIEKQVGELEKKIQLESRTIELSHQYLGEPESSVEPASVRSDNSVLDEIDAKFSLSDDAAKGDKADDKSL